MAQSHYTRIEGIVGAFLNGDSQNSYHRNRMTTHEKDNGNICLVGYGWLKLAEFDPSDNEVTVFTGHQSIRSKTVSGWTQRVLEHTRDSSRNLEVSTESPSVYTPPGIVDYIGEYVSFTPNKSAVEEQAVDDVVEALRDVFDRDLRL